jgi:hypothetical protein
VKRIRKITRHTLKFFIIPLFAFFFLGIGAASALFYFYPKQKVLAIVTDAAEQTLKRKVTAEGIRYNMGGVRVSGVTVLNSMNPGDSALIRFSSIDIHFSLSSFLRNRIEITALVIHDMDLTLYYKNNAWNLKSLIDDISSAPKQAQKKKKNSSSSIALKQIRLDHASVTLESSPAVIRSLVGRYLFTGTVDISRKDSISVLDFALTLPEGRGTIESESVAAAPLDETFSITGNAKLISASMGWLYQWGGIDLPYSIVSGTITDLKVTKDILEGTLDGRSHLSNKAELKAQGSFKAHFRPFSLSITETRIHTGSSTARVKAIHVATGAAPRFAVDQVDAQVEQIAPLIPGFPSKLYGHVSGDLSSDGSLFSGKLSLDNVGFDRESKLLSALSGEVTVSKNVFRAENLPVKILSNDATVSVAAPENLLREITVNLRSPVLNIAEGRTDPAGKPAQTAYQPVQRQNSHEEILLIPIRVRGNLDIGQIRKDSLILSKLECSYDFAGKILTLPRFRCSVLDATIAGSGTVDLTGISPTVEAKLSVEDLKVQNLSIFKEEIKGRLFGSAKARASISLKPLDDDIISSIKGTCDFSVANGKVANTGVQDALGIWLDPLKYKLKDLEFNTISGSVKMDQGNFDIRTLIFNSPEIRLMVDGTIAKKTELNSKIALEFTSTFIQDLPNPALLRLNRYKKGRWYTIHISAKGNIPEAKYDVSEIP